MIKMMQSFTISVDEFDDGMDIFGGTIKGATINSFGDHRIAMTAIIASLVSNGDIIVEDCQNIDTSFPTFIELSNTIGMDIQNHD
jgi:3-phosphoshikimate 1-carboxyvinyltransferase